MKKAITVLGLGAAAVAISVSNASAMEQQDAGVVEQQDAQTTTGINLREQPGATSNKVSELHAGSKIMVGSTFRLKMVRADGLVDTMYLIKKVTQ